MTGWVDVDHQPPSAWRGNMLCSHNSDGRDGHSAVIHDAANYTHAWIYMLTGGNAGARDVATDVRGRARLRGEPTASGMSSCACVDHD